MQRDAAGIVRSRLRQTLGLACVISRGIRSCTAIVALGRSELIATAKNEFRIQSDAQELLIDAASYEPTGSASDPKDNDRISVTMIDGSTALFEVRAPSQGQQCFQNSPNGTELRIHAKRVNPVKTTI